MIAPDSEAARRFLTYGATALPVGIALAAIGQATIGSMVTLAALAALIAGVHTFGRAGPDPGA
jgi:hypothetical protein